MCARIEDYQIVRSGYTKLTKQHDHNWMIANARDAYDENMKMIMGILNHIEFESLFEFNGGSVGIFGNLSDFRPSSKEGTGLDETEPKQKKIKSYRFMDEHHDCVKQSYTNNEIHRANRSHVSFHGIVGNVWEYEDIVAPPYRYKADVSVIHYLSLINPKFLQAAAFMLCRLTNTDIIITDYSESDCPVNIAELFEKEMGNDIRVHTSGYSQMTDKNIKYTETIYHIQK